MRGAQQFRRGGGVGLLALALISGCSGKDCCAPLEVLSIQLAPTNSGDQQTATVGSTLPHPLRVLVRRGGKPASGVEVSWTAIQGQLSAPQTTTDASGIAVVRWTLDTLAGRQSAGAEIPGGVPPDTAVGFSAVASPGPATRLLFQVQPANVFASRPLSVVQVAAVDLYGNVATDFGGSITVTLGPSGSLAGTESETAVRGVATFGDLSIAQPGTGYTLEASAAGLTSVASAAFDVVMPGPGRIVFQSDRDGNNEIYSMNADGSGQVNLTHNPASDESPVWSPGGFRIAFISYRDGNGEIYLMNADGSGQVNLSHSPAVDDSPMWSPDGSKIVFRSIRDGNDEIYVINADGSGLRNLTNNPALDVSPAWSPDGSKIAFVSERDGNGEIYEMNADGSGQVNLTNNPANDGIVAVPQGQLSHSPVWSPDGSKIVFVSDRDGHGGANVWTYVMNADGSGQANLVSAPVYGSPVWSPDGTRIAFTSLQLCGRCQPFGWIRVMKADGSGGTQLTSTGRDFSPIWSPDGTRIAFRSVRDGNSEIYVMNADGSAVIRLTNNPASDMWPAWSP